MKKYKILEFSENMKDWEVRAIWTEEEAPAEWKKLIEWIEGDQPYGFFRMTLEGYADE